MSNIGKAKKKPVIVDFVIWTGSEQSTKAALNFMGQPTNCNKSRDVFSDYHNHCLERGLDVETLEDGVDKRAKHVASVGDYILKGVQGEFYPCKPDIFLATYDILRED